MILEDPPQNVKISSNPRSSKWLQHDEMEELFQKAANEIQANLYMQLESHSHFCKDVLWHMQHNLTQRNDNCDQETCVHDSWKLGIMTKRNVSCSTIEHQTDDFRRDVLASPDLKNIQQKASRNSKFISSAKRRAVHEKMGAIRKLVRSKRFECMSAVVIFANSVLVGYQVNGNTIPHDKLGVIQLVFAVFFCGELLLRLCADGRRYVTHNRLWNMFEVVTVAGSLIEVAVHYYAFLASSLNISLLRVIRFLRCIRMLGMFRMGAFRELRLMISTMFCCFKPFLWTLLLLSIDVYIFAVAFTQCTRDAVDDKVLSYDDVAFLSENFSTLKVSAITLLAILEGITDWRQITDVLSRVHGAYTVALLLYIFATQLALLNVITAIFVDSSMAAALTDKQMLVQEELLREGNSRDELVQVFAEAAEGKTHVPVHKLKQYMMDERVKTYLRVLGIKYATARDFVDTLDVNHNGEVDFEEFVETCLKMKSGFLTDTHAVLQETSYKLFEIRNAIKDLESQMKQYHARDMERQSKTRVLVSSVMSASSRKQSAAEELQTGTHILPTMNLPEDSLPYMPPSKIVSVLLPRGCPNRGIEQSC